MTIQLNPDEARQFAASNYGMFAWFMNDPQIGPLIMQSAARLEDPSLLEARLSGTAWWRKRSGAMREYEDMQHRDPATLDRKVKQTQAMVEDMGRQMGLTNFDWGTTAQNAVRYDLNDAEIRNLLASHLTMDSTREAGSAGYVFNLAKERANQQMISMSDEEAYQWAQQVARGDTTLEFMQERLDQIAADRWSHLKSHIEGGGTVRQFFSEHQQTVAQLLERNVDDIDMADAKWNWITRAPAGNGSNGQTFKALDLNETAKGIRRMDEWQDTSNAKRVASTLAANIAKAFGEMR